MTMINCKEIMLHTGCTQMYCIDTKLWTIWTCQQEEPSKHVSH